jgi:hypothetical protein
MIKAIITDFDGTLLNNHGTLSTRTKSTLKKIEEKGLLFVAASGRFYPGIHRVISPYIQNAIYCCNNGTWIEAGDRSKIFQKSIFTDDEMHALFLEAEHVLKQYPNLACFSCDSDHAYVERVNGNLVAALLRAHTKTTCLPVLAAYRRNISKLSFFCREGLNAEQVQALSGIGQTHERFQTGTQWFDIQKKGVTKANIFDVLKETFQIKPEETLVFGDSYNDIEMLLGSPNSYAMAQAPLPVQKSARHLAPSNQADGVASVIESLGLFE